MIPQMIKNIPRTAVNEIGDPNNIADDIVNITKSIVNNALAYPGFGAVTLLLNKKK